MCLLVCMENSHNIDAVMHMLGYLEAHHWEDALKNYNIKGLKELRNHNNEYWGNTMELEDTLNIDFLC